MYTKDTRHSQSLNSHDLNDDIRKVKEKVFETRDALSQTAHDARDRAGEFLNTSLHDMKHKSEEIQENVITYVKAHPVKSVGFAVLTGLIAAILLRK